MVLKIIWPDFSLLYYVWVGEKRVNGGGGGDVFSGWWGGQAGLVYFQIIFIAN